MFGLIRRGRREVRARLMRDYMLDEDRAQRVLDLVRAGERSWIAAIGAVTGEGRAEVLGRAGRAMIRRYRDRHGARAADMDDTAVLEALGRIDERRLPAPRTAFAVHAGGLGRGLAYSLARLSYRVRKGRGKGPSLPVFQRLLPPSV